MLNANIVLYKLCTKRARIVTQRTYLSDHCNANEQNNRYSIFDIKFEDHGFKIRGEIKLERFATGQMTKLAREVPPNPNLSTYQLLHSYLPEATPSPFLFLDFFSPTLESLDQKTKSRIFHKLSLSFPFFSGEYIREFSSISAWLCSFMYSLSILIKVTGQVGSTLCHGRIQHLDDQKKFLSFNFQGFFLLRFFLTAWILFFYCLGCRFLDIKVGMIYLTCSLVFAEQSCCFLYLCAKSTITGDHFMFDFMMTFYEFLAFQGCCLWFKAAV